MAEHKVQETHSIKKRAKTTAQGPRKYESPAAKAYRLQGAAKLTNIAAGTCKLNSESRDVYDFPESSAWLSPPSSIDGIPPCINRMSVCGDDDGDSGTRKANNNVDTGTSDLPIDTVVDILAATDHDFDLTEAAFASIMKHAAAAATPDDKFGVSFIRDLVSRVAELSAQDEWLVIVVAQLQQRLTSLNDRARCQISALGKLSLPNGSSSVMEIAQPCTEACPGSTPSSEDTFVTHEDSTNIVMPEVANSVEDENPHVIHAAHLQNKEGRSPSTIDKEYHSHARSSTSSLWVLRLPPVKSRAVVNPTMVLPLLAHRIPHPDPSFGSAYDFFARSVLDAHRSPSSPVSRNKHVYKGKITRLWVDAAAEHRAAWMKLFNARPGAVPLLVRGQRLLLSQGMLTGSPNSEHRPKHKR